MPTNDRVRTENAANLTTLAGLVAANPIDSIVLNRVVARGPDPFCLVATSADLARKVARLFWFSSDDGGEAKVRAAIELAHKVGPAALLAGGQGLLIGRSGERRSTLDWAESESLEAAWLILADACVTAEAGYPADASLASRVGALVDAAMRVERILAECDEGAAGIVSYVEDALERTVGAFTFKAIGQGREHHVEAVCSRPGREDFGFYAAYKAGYHVCRVTQGGMTFWGTDGSTTLAAEGITVDKVISPYFGLVFPKT